VFGFCGRDTAQPKWRFFLRRGDEPHRIRASVHRFAQSHWFGVASLVALAAAIPGYISFASRRVAPIYAIGAAIPLYLNTVVLGAGVSKNSGPARARADGVGARVRNRARCRADRVRGPRDRGRARVPRQFALAGLAVRSR
jgi:hypothetical protein